VRKSKRLHTAEALSVADVGAIPKHVDSVNHRAIVAMLCGIINRVLKFAKPDFCPLARRPASHSGEVGCGFKAEFFVGCLKVHWFNPCSICAHASATVNGMGLRSKAYAVPLFGAIPMRRQSSPRLMPRRW